MTKVFQGFRIVILIAALLPLSCSTFLKPSNTLSTLAGQDAIIFGKVEFLKNDKVTNEPDESFLDPDPSIFTHVSHYVSDDALSRNIFSPGEYYFRTRVYKDNYFAYAIPPGKYYFHMFTYTELFDAKPAFDLRTFTANGAPFLMTFEVSSNQAVYLGTIRHNFNMNWDNWFFFKGNWTIDCTNEFDAAKKWFVKSNPRFETNVVEGLVKFRRLPN
jgi:hypothetical protein